MDATDAIVNAIIHEKGPPYASSSFVVNIDTEGRVECARVKYKKEIINVRGSDGLFYSEGCKNSRDPITMNEFKTGDEVIQTEDGTCFGVNEGYSIEDLQFKDPFSKKEIERDCFDSDLVPHSEFRRLQNQGFDFNVPRGQDTQNKYKDSVASRVRETSKRRRFTSTKESLPQKKLNFEKMMDYYFFLSPDGSGLELPSEFQRLFPGLQNFDVGWWNRPPAKLGKYYKDVASKEYYDKLLDGKTSLRIERRNNKWENINIEMKDDNTPYVLI